MDDAFPKQPLSIDQLISQPHHHHHSIHRRQHRKGKMHLMYYMGADGKRVYTLRKETPTGEVTYSAHPGTSEVMTWFGCWVIRSISYCIDGKGYSASWTTQLLRPFDRSIDLLCGERAPHDWTDVIRLTGLSHGITHKTNHTQPASPPTTSSASSASPSRSASASSPRSRGSASSNSNSGFKRDGRW